MTSSLSLEGFDWILSEPIPNSHNIIPEIPALLLQLFYTRGIITKDDVNSYLYPELSQLHDPFLIQDMDTAVQRIIKARDHNELISVFGDFDTDGISATVLLYEELLRIGCKVLTYIPNRSEEGHGLNKLAIDYLEKSGVSLIITVDTGITAIEEVSYANDRNIDTIITDHHVPNEIAPKALAILSCDSLSTITEKFLYPFQHLTGAGLAFKLVQALDDQLSLSILNKSLEMAAIGTIADMAPLLGENRVIAIEGLKSLKQTNRPGFNQLFRLLKLDKEYLDHSTIPFILSPRINAPGRLGSPDLSFKFLTEKNIDQAELLAKEIENVNNQRKRLTQESLEIAMKEADQQSKTESMIVLFGENYNLGLIGLIAGRISEKYNRPAFVVTQEDGLLRGSGRSVAWFDIVSAFEKCSSLFLKHGGHKAAGGFTAERENFEEIKAKLKSIARDNSNIEEIKKSIKIDSVVLLKDLVGETFSLISSMEPFGIGNPDPIFMSQNVQIKEIRFLGIRRNFVSLKMVQDNVTWDGFSSAKIVEKFPFEPNKNNPLNVDVVYNVEKSSYQGVQIVRLRIIDLKLYVGTDIC